MFLRFRIHFKWKRWIVKFVTDFFVRSKLIKKLDGALFTNDDMTILNEGG